MVNGQDPEKADWMGQVLGFSIQAPAPGEWGIGEVLAGEEI